ncbi:MAG: two-component regulator propeller domain-containing protein [Candidatus Pseudobacter hemicellulosilyticus]|uniref:histidine kinase n=1 Tax=Candidatus Pseudobacter hemicellulosilyticus TaxID=3121375 RepID=A0AAJ6BJJ6_9BACT|nr:MAG: two-component regulator propeller domain-containing protein [Pseudobacter sp.]
MLKKFHFACLLTVSVCCCLGQQPHYKFYNYSTENGLPTNTYGRVFQDAAGFLWLASFDGLFRWDGYSIKKYVHEENDSASLDHNIVYTIYEDRQQRLWVGTIEGLNLYNRETDNFTQVRLMGPGVRVPINAMLEDKPGNLWLGTSKGLCRYNAATQETKWFSSNARQDVVFCLAADQQQQLWLGTYSEGVMRFDPATGHFSSYRQTAAPGSLLCNNIKSILVDRQNRIWVGTDKGIDILNNQGRLMERMADLFAGNANTRKIISCLYQDRSGNIWIGVARDLLYCLPYGAALPRPVTATTRNNNHDKISSVTAITEDNAGNTWFASMENGLFYTNDRKNVFQSYLAMPVETKGLSTTVVTSFLEAKDGSLWVGTNGDGLLHWDPRSNAAAPEKVSAFAGMAINDIKRDAQGLLWLATWGSGIHSFDPATGKQSALQPKGSLPALASSDVKTILPDDSLLYIGTHGEGLALYNLHTHQLTDYRNNHSLPFDLRQPAWINHLFKDSRKRLWISTYSGVFLFDGKGLRHFEHTADTNSISNNSVNMVIEDGKGQVWVVSERGLDRFREQPAVFQRYASRYRLPEAMKSVVTDARDRLWIGSNEGIVCFDPATGGVSRYDQHDGLHARSFFQKSVLQTTGGQLFFGSPKGIDFFYPDSLRPLNIPSSFYFTDLTIYSQLQRPGYPGSPLAKVLALTDTLVLHESQSFFSIGFTAVNLYAAGKISYSYLLEGVHDQWLDLNGERRISFTNLSPGSYLLKLRFTDADGRWQAGIRELHIIILPPWYKTGWFLALVGMAVAAAVVGFFYWRVAAVQQKNRQLEAEVQKRTGELNEMNASLVGQNDEIKQQKEKLEISNEEMQRQTDKILEQQQHILSQNQILAKAVTELEKTNATKDHFFSILAHDLKSPVSALADLLGYLKHNLLKMDKQALQEYLDSMHASSAAVYDLLVNLLNWSGTQSGRIQHDPEPVNMAALLEKNVQLLEPQFNNKHIRLEVQINRTHWVYVDQQMVDAVLRNLLSNSIKFTNYNGRVNISCHEKENAIEIIISDTGIGMSASQLQHLFSLDRSRPRSGTAGEKGTGLGLLITKGFLQINGGTLSVESREGEGSVFRVLLPKATMEGRQEPGAGVEMAAEGQAGTDFWASYPLDRLMRIKGAKVLIVDDNPELRNYCKLILSETFEIFEAGTGREGMDIAKKILPAIILTDILMPGMDGLEFCRQLKADTTTSHIPVILLTSQWESSMQVSGYEAGADVYLTKPIKKELLIQVILNSLFSQERNHVKLVENMMTSEGMPAPGAGMSMNKADEEFLQKTVAFIEAHLSDLSLDARQICRELAISRTVLYAKIKALTGQSVHEFIKSIRLRKSVLLLLEGKLSINQVAFEVGFNSHSYFDKCFVKQYGVGPKEYIRRRSGKDIRTTG